VIQITKWCFAVTEVIHRLGGQVVNLCVSINGNCNEYRKNETMHVSMICAALPCPSFASELIGAGERQKLKLASSPDPRTSPERTYKILGHPFWPTEASRWVNAHCLHPAFTSVTVRVQSVRGHRPSLRGRADVALDGSKISFRPGRGCAKKDKKTIYSLSAKL